MRLFSRIGAVLCLVAAVSCGQVKYIPVKGDTVVEYRDSIVTRIDTVKITLPPQKVRDYSDLKDTLVLRNDYSVSRAWVNQEKGRIEGTLETTPKAVDVPVPVTEEYHQKDSVRIEIKYEEIEVEKIVKIVPRFWRFFGILGIILSILFLFKLYLKIKTKYF